MDCRTFHKKHVAFVDDTLPGCEMVAMRRHRDGCERCARHDATIRRALMVARSLPTIEPSPDFAARLEARLAMERRARTSPPPVRYAHGPGLRAFMAIAATVVVVGYVALSLLGDAAPSRVIALQPVVATEPAGEPEAMPPLAAPALVTTAAAGLPVWPVMFLAEEAPVHFASEQFAR